MKRRKNKQPSATPIHLCGLCSNGYRIVIREGERFASRCGCWKYRFINPPTVDYKSKAAGK